VIFDFKAYKETLLYADYDRKIEFLCLIL